MASEFKPLRRTNQTNKHPCIDASSPEQRMLEIVSFLHSLNTYHLITRSK